MSEEPKQNNIDRQYYITGYTRIGIEEGDGSYNAGFSMYSSAWPLLDKYPGHDFQSGLFGTWMFADSENPEKEGVWFYSDIEGGLGWWRDTRFPTTTPKFTVGAVALGFCAWSNGPGAGKGRDWDNPTGHYGTAQLSNRLLWPPDALNLKQGTSSELIGYGYLPLPFTKAKTSTAGHPVPTGDQCWTLFLNTKNFKGPATFVLPYFLSEPSIEHPETAGRFLDSCPSKQNRHHSMETQYIPWAQAKDKNGNLYARMAPTYIPAGTDNRNVVLHQVTAYNKIALWDKVKKWFDGGEIADTRIEKDGSHKHSFDNTRGIEWGQWEPKVDRNSRKPIIASDFVQPDIPDPYSLAYKATSDLVTKTNMNGVEYVILPEYYRFYPDQGERGSWVAIAPDNLPTETKLNEYAFPEPEEDAPEPYITPDSPESCWKKPGPVAGPFKADLGDGSVVTYYWYRFSDQPSMLNADLSDEERADIQLKVEKMHKEWTKDKEYLDPPAAGELAELDTALIVTPPDGLEIGYVPIVTDQRAQ
jgi:hypothetical protein